MSRKQGHPLTVIERMRERIRNRDYYLSSHAEEEMVEDSFERPDIENALLAGFVEKRLARDPRGTRYRVEGPANDGRIMHVLCRFKEAGALIIITVYEKERSP